MVGFNRRFAPLTIRLREELSASPPPTLLARVNAGPLADDHWLNDPEEGAESFSAKAATSSTSWPTWRIPVPYSSAPSRHPSRGGSSSAVTTSPPRCASRAAPSERSSIRGRETRLPKERIEAFGGGLAAVIDDFRRLELYRNGKRAVVKGAQDKGHRAEIACFLKAARGEVEPPSVQSYADSTRATLALAESLRSGLPVELP